VTGEDIREVAQAPRMAGRPRAFRLEIVHCEPRGADMPGAAVLFSSRRSTAGLGSRSSFISSVSQASTWTPATRKKAGGAETPARAGSPAARAPSVGQLARSPTVHRSCGLAGLSASSLLGRCARSVVTPAVDVTRRRWKRPLRRPGALRVGGGGFWPAVSLRRSSPQRCRPAGDGAGRIRSPPRRTTESSSKHQKYCGLGPRLRSRCGHPQLDGRVRGRKGGEAGTSRTSGSGSRARASFPS
jgi:hypothetical protein